MRTRSGSKKATIAEPDDAPADADDAKDVNKQQVSDGDGRNSVVSQCHSFTIPIEGKKDIPCELRGAAPGTSPSLIWTHGAGGGIDNPATRDFAEGFAQEAPVIVFQSNSNLANRIQIYKTVMEHVKFSSALAGRSMGARAAGTIAAEEEAAEAVVLVSYPLIGAGGDVRDEILLNLPGRVDVLFVIGSKDSMCPFRHFEEVRAKMKARSWLAVAEGADHGMAINAKADSAAFRRKTGELAAKWLERRDPKKRLCEVSWDDERREPVVSAWREDDRKSDGGEAVEPELKKQKMV